MSASLRIPARNEVEEPTFEPLEQGVHRAKLKGWTDPVTSQYPIKGGERDGEYPQVIALIYTVNGEEIRTKQFDFQNPHNKTLMMNQNALAGRKIADDEDFDFGDYIGKEVNILVVHKEKVGRDGQVMTFANIENVNPVKKAAKKPVESFPDDDEEF